MKWKTFQGWVEQDLPFGPAVLGPVTVKPPIMEGPLAGGVCREGGEGKQGVNRGEKEENIHGLSSLL